MKNSSMQKDVAAANPIGIIIDKGIPKLDLDFNHAPPVLIAYHKSPKQMSAQELMEFIGAIMEKHVNQMIVGQMKTILESMVHDVAQSTDADISNRWYEAIEAIKAHSTEALVNITAEIGKHTAWALEERKRLTKFLDGCDAQVLNYLNDKWTPTAKAVELKMADAISTRCEEEHTARLKQAKQEFFEAVEGEMLEFLADAEKVQAELENRLSSLEGFKKYVQTHFLNNACVQLKEAA